MSANPFGFTAAEFRELRQAIAADPFYWDKFTCNRRHSIEVQARQERRDGAWKAFEHHKLTEMIATLKESIKLDEFNVQARARDRMQAAVSAGAARMAEVLLDGEPAQPRYPARPVARTTSVMRSAPSFAPPTQEPPPPEPPANPLEDENDQLRTRSQNLALHSLCDSQTRRADARAEFDRQQARLARERPRG